jgi:hypothetical protein
MSKIAVATIALFLICTRPVPVDAVPSPLAEALADQLPPYEGCWRPPSRNTRLMSRNIGIDEPSCDSLGKF